MRYNYRTQNVCAVQISFDLEGDKVSNIQFLGGCNGNLKAISKLVDGMCGSACHSRKTGLRGKQEVIFGA